MTHGNEIPEYGLHRYAIEKTRELVGVISPPFHVDVVIVPKCSTQFAAAEIMVSAPYGNLSSKSCIAVISWARNTIDAAQKLPLPSATRIIDSIAAHEAAHLVSFAHDEAHKMAIASLGYTDLEELPEYGEYHRCLYPYTRDIVLGDTLW